MSVKLKKNDEVIVICGKDKGKIGKILSVVSNKSSDVVKLIVSGINIRKKAVKPSAGKAGGMVSFEGVVDVSNVAYFDSESGSRSRIGYKFVDNKKVRFLKASGRILD